VTLLATALLQEKGRVMKLFKIAALFLLSFAWVRLSARRLYWQAKGNILRAPPLSWGYLALALRYRS